jgi:3-keto-5-aminohexanoate cleavage enzyme
MKRRQPPLTGRDEDIYLDHVMPINFAETEVLAREMKERGIKPDLEVYNPSMFIVADNLMCQGLLERPYSFSVYFGKMFGVPATAQNLVATVAGFPPNSVWHAIGVDYVQVSITTMAIAMGGNVRVGFEDNVFYRRGELLRSNAQAVERVVRTANELERSIATPAQAREILGLSQTPRTYD